MFIWKTTKRIRYFGKICLVIFQAKFVNILYSIIKPSFLSIVWPYKCHSYKFYISKIVKTLYTKVGAKKKILQINCLINEGPTYYIWGCFILFEC